MLLILAQEDDSLAHALCRAARRSGTDVLMCGKPEMTGRHQQSLSLESVVCDGARLKPREVSGVLFRLGTRWWHTGSAADDQDLIAAWCTLLWDLPCPVVNRFSWSWWFDPTGYAVQLSLHLNAAVPSARYAARSENGPVTVYTAGSAFIPAGPAFRPAADRLSADGAALQQWQTETGITLARLTFGNDRATPVSVDPCPDFRAESAEVTEQVADAICATLIRSA